jgi:hypothetical protein
MDILATLQVYKELAEWYERQGQAAMRDRFLILAAEAAFSAGKPEEAERLRQRLLQGNPHHMLKPFSSFAQALQSTNIQIYIHDLQANYPPETAEGLLQDLRSGAPPTQPASGLGESTRGAVPQTAPLIEIRDEPTLPLGAEPLKVYPLQKEPEPTRPPGPPVKPAHSNRPSPGKPAAAPDRPSALNTPSPRSQPALPRSPHPTVAPVPAPLPPPSEPAAPSGAWLPLLLFGMTVTAGVALAFYTLAHPFLPREWLP